MVSLIPAVWRGRRYYLRGWQCWYERCPVTHQAALHLTVVSETFPQSPLYPGGNFRLKLPTLLDAGKVFHSRHGEWFYLTQPEIGALFPSVDVMASPDPLHHELATLGWQLNALTASQQNCVIRAIQLGITIQQAQTRLALGE